jgi:excisionase family DNA binding protein
MTPLEVRLVLTREAAKVLGCSIRQVRALAAAGKLKNWSLGPSSVAYDLEDLKRYKAEKEVGTPP